MDIKNIAKQAITKRVFKHKIDLKECAICRYAEYGIPNGYSGRSTINCSIIGDYVHDDNYDCPKKSDEYTYCKKLDTYCHKENTCIRCPMWQPQESDFEELREENGGYKRK